MGGQDGAVSADVLLGLPVVVLSHRGPVSFTADEGGEREVHRGAGGLVSALTGLAAYLPEAVWVCVAPPGPDAAVAPKPPGSSYGWTWGRRPGCWATPNRPGPARCRC